MTEETSTTRPPVTLPNYTLGTEAATHHYNPTCTRDEAAIAAQSLRVNDAAFIKRSDLKWTYAIVTERNVDDDGKVTLRFEVDESKNRKSFPENQWGKYIRVIVVKDEETTASEGVAADADEKSVKSSKTASIKTKLSSDGSVKTTKSKNSVKGSVKGAFKSLVGGKKKEEETATTATTPVIEEEKKEEVVAEETAKVEEETPAVAAPADTTAAAVESAPVEPKVEEAAKPEEKKETTTKTESSSGWFSSFFGSSPKPETKKVEAPVVAAEAAKETHAPAVETTAKAEPEQKEATTSAPEAPKPTATTTPTTPAKSIQVTTTPGASVEAAIDARDDKSSKENYPEASEQLTMPKPFLPSTPGSAKSVSSTTKRNPAGILKFKFGNKPKTPAPLSPGAASITSFMKSPPTSPTGSTMMTPTTPKKEWFDPEATECDYDTNPTDLFQALEAREFDYAFEMYEQTNQAFTKDCKTWVIAKGVQKGSALRFRALPLHAAIVFDAPDELIIKILRAYPKATRGRDVKGRLPIHLAFEHQTSDQVIALIIDAFPKGFFAKDKKEMTPLDHVNGNTTRSYMARYIPQILAAKMEEEREKWNIEANMLLEHQKATLQNDEEFMAEVITHVQEEVEAHNMAKIELLEANYQKEIELLKKKHDSETQALLEGFEVKLNFERKLNKLKVKQ